MIKIIKIGLLNAAVFGTAYFVAQREYDLDIGIYKAFYNQLYYYAPRQAVQFMKIMCFQNLFWKQQINAEPFNSNNLEFKNQIGISSGFDNDGTLIESLQNIGFGFIEIGSIMPQKSQRMIDDINNYQTKNQSIDYISELPQLGILKTKALLVSLRQNNNITVPIGINIMPSEDIYKYAPYLISQDIANAARELCSVSDFQVLNLTSGSRTSKIYKELVGDNVAVVRDMIQSIKTVQIEEIGLQAALEHEQKNQLKEDCMVSDYLSATPIGLKQKIETPIFVKISTTQSTEVINFLIQQSLKNEIQGIIFQKEKEINEDEYLNKLKNLKQQLSQKTTLISVGGIQTKQDFNKRIQAGANACQILSQFIIEGPYALKNIMN